MCIILQLKQLHQIRHFCKYCTKFPNSCKSSLYENFSITDNTVIFNLLLIAICSYSVFVLLLSLTSLKNSLHYFGLLESKSDTIHNHVNSTVVSEPLLIENKMY